MLLSTHKVLIISLGILTKLGFIRKSERFHKIHPRSKSCHEYTYLITYLHIQTPFAHACMYHVINTYHVFTIHEMNHTYSINVD
jgi:hypothetical protein